MTITPASIAKAKSDELAFLIRTLARIREVCGIGNDVPHEAMPEAIRTRMTVRPSKELIGQMIRSGK